jgi:hypothetical protein
MEEFSHYEGRNHSLAVIVFFCTLGEVLLGNFWTWHMTKKGQSSRDTEKQLKNLSKSKLVKKLFPQVTGGVQWLKALGEISIDSGVDYLDLNGFYMRASVMRNDLLHGGRRRTDPEDMSKECIRRVKSMLDMFVALHNKYIVPFKYSGF